MHESAINHRQKKKLAAVRAQLGRSAQLEGSTERDVDQNHHSIHLVEQMSQSSSEENYHLCQMWLAKCLVISTL